MEPRKHPIFNDLAGNVDFTSRFPLVIPPGVLKIRGKSSVADRIGSFAERTPRGFFHGGRSQVLEFSYADSLGEDF